VTGLTLVAGNDDANGSLQSEVEFNAVAGTTYRIQVDGFAFDYGSFRLSYGVNRPANDDFAAAQALPGAVGNPLAATTARATGQAGEPAPIGGAADASLWYSWTAPESGTARFTTFGSNYDTTLAAYTGALPAPAQVAANDDSGGTLQSLISFAATAGTTYRIQVGGFAGLRGNVTLQYTVNPPANDLFAGSVIAGAGGAVAGSTARAVAEPGEPNFGWTPDASVWWTWTAPATGNFRFTTTGSNYDTVLAVATGGAITGLTTVAANDDANGTLQSQVQFGATAGTVYRIWVDGFALNRGNVQLNWAAV
jgi:hypothetical protein